MSPSLFCRTPVFVAGCLLAAAAPAATPAHATFRLANGLTVVVHEDHAVPAVSIDLGFRVGAGDDPAGKSGMAHLFEHLMFTGSAHYPAPFLPAMLDLGAADANATTGPDGTHYVETVPRSALDRALWLESDRMGYLAGALSQQDLDTQRGVARGEMRTSESRPFASVDAHVLRHLYPANHPYRHDILGNPADLDAISLDDARRWAGTYYGAANATLVLAGDITLADARARAEQYFGELAPGPTVAHPRPWAPVLPVSTRSVVHEAGSGRRIVRAWVFPARGHADLPSLALARVLLIGHPESHLRRRLVEEDGIAVAVRASLERQALASEFTLTVDLAESASIGDTERALDEALASFLTSVGTADDIALAKGDDALASAETMESVAVRASDLAESHILEGDPGAASRFRERLQAVGPDETQAAVQRWLGQPHHTAIVLPPGSTEGAAEGDIADGDGRAAGTSPGATMHFTDGLTSAFHGADRSAPPAVGLAPPLVLPPVQRARLANGAELLLMSRADSPLTRVRFLFGGGYAADHGRPPGTANLAMQLLADGTERRSADDFHRDIRRLGAALDTGCRPDACFVGLAAPAASLRGGLALTVEALRQPLFPAAGFERLRQRWQALVGLIHADAEAAGDLLMLRRLYGDHPYASEGDGTPASLATLQRSDLIRFHRDIVRPDNLVAVVVVGDISLADAVAGLDEAMAGWAAPQSPAPVVAAHAEPVPVAPVVYLVDVPDAPQSVLTFGALVPGNGDTDTTARELASMTWAKAVDNELRERRGWSYGASSQVGNRRGWRPWMFHAGVETAHTADAVAFAVQAMQAQARGIDLLAFERERNGLLAALPSLLSTDYSLTMNLATVLTLGLPDDRLATLSGEIASVSPVDIARVTASAMTAEHRVWVISGDRRRIEPALRTLMAGPLGEVLGELRVVSAGVTAP